MTAPDVAARALLLLVGIGTVLIAPSGCGGWQVSSDEAASESIGGEAGEGGGGANAGQGGVGGSGAIVTSPVGLHVVGNRIEDADGAPVVLRGVNRSGSEYKCVQAAGFFEGPADAASIQAMASWNINSVRVPLNESCWLARNGASPRYSGEAYKNAIAAYVGLLQAHGMVPILELHWAAPGAELASELWPMPNADHSIDFWTDVARTFRDNDGVVFEVYNEPYPDLNRDTEAAWNCWRDGCEATQYGMTETYTAVGMQSLVDAIRAIGARQIILLGGVQYSNGLSRWLEFRPEDPLANLGAAWHIYDFNPCASTSCWQGAPATLAAEVPIVATEVGQSDCAGDTHLQPLLDFLDEHGSGYLAWSWNAAGNCAPRVPRMQEGQPWFLITDYATGEPNSDYARTFRDHLLRTSVLD